MPKLLPIDRHARADEGGARRLILSAAAPAPTIMAGGVGSVNENQYRLPVGGAPRRVPGKPPYRVPSMAEVAAAPWCGLTVASAFSGCGGSCTGYRMAGFRVGWASEFVPSAADCYAANAARDDPFSDQRPGVLDRRDIRRVTAGEILAAIGLRPGELDLFDGSPPCQAFSTAGKGAKGWGESKRYEGGHKQRNEDLFAVWVRLLRGLSPRAFVAENVSGLVKGACKGLFLELLRDMRAAGYAVVARLLDAARLGVPQSRVRVIFVGVREDLGLPPAHPAPLPFVHTVADALPWLSGISNESTSAFAAEPTMDAPIASIVASGQGQRFRVACGNDAFEPRFGDPAAGPSPTIQASGARTSGFVEWSGRHAQGLTRGVADGPCPSVTASGAAEMLVCGPPAPEPESSMDGLAVGGGAASCASVTHPTKRRKFSLLELRRLCGFPDDFALPTTYEKAWRCLGNAVPPVMAFWTARTVRDRVLLPALGLPPFSGDPACLLAGTKFRVPVT